MNTFQPMHNPKNGQLQVGLGHGRNWLARIRDLLVVATGNHAARALDVLAQGIDIRGLEMKKIGQSHNAMIINDACHDGLTEAKMNEHLAHLLFHVLAMLVVGCECWGKDSTNSKKSEDNPKSTQKKPRTKNRSFVRKEHMDRYSIPWKMGGG